VKPCPKPLAVQRICGPEAGHSGSSFLTE